MPFYRTGEAPKALPQDVQDWVDTLVAAFHAGHSTSDLDVYAQLTDWFEEHEDAVELNAATETCLIATSLASLPESIDDAVGAHFELGDDDPVTDDQRL